MQAALAAEEDEEGTVVFETPRVFQPLLPPSRYKGAYGGRGSAKSWFFADLLIDHSIAYPPLRSVCIREVQRTLEHSVYRLLRDRIAFRRVGHMFLVRNTHIVTPGGGVIIFQGMQNHTADSIKSLEGFNRAWVEEAQSFSQRSLDLLRPTFRRDDSEIWFSWNPRRATDPIDSFFRGSSLLPTDVALVRANYYDNPWFPEVLRKEMEWDKRRDPAKYAHIWLGEYETVGAARVFNNWVVDEFESPDGVDYLYGADWGFAEDPVVLIRCWSDRKARKLFVDREVYGVGVEIDDIPALFDQLDGTKARKHPITADSARPEIISYLRRKGYPKIKPSIKGAGSVEQGVLFLQNYDIVVHPRCKHLIDELSLYSYKTDPLTGKVLPVLVDKDNHCIDSLRYAVEDDRRATKGALLW